MTERPRPGVLAVLAGVGGFLFGLLTGPLLALFILAVLGLVGNALGGGWIGIVFVPASVLGLFLVFGLLSSQAEVADGSTPRRRFLSIALLGLVGAILLALLMPASYACAHARSNQTVPSVFTEAPGGTFGATTFWVFPVLVALALALDCAPAWYEHAGAVRFQTGWRLLAGLVLGAVAGGMALVAACASFAVSLGAGHYLLVDLTFLRAEPFRSAHRALTASDSAAAWSLAGQFGVIALVGAVFGAGFGVFAEATGYELHRKRFVVAKSVGAAVLFLALTGLVALSQQIPAGLLVLAPLTVLVTFATGAATFGLIYGGKPWVEASLAAGRPVGPVVLAGLCVLVLGGSLLVWWRLVSGG